MDLGLAKEPNPPELVMLDLGCLNLKYAKSPPTGPQGKMGRSLMVEPMPNLTMLGLKIVPPSLPCFNKEQRSGGGMGV